MPAGARKIHALTPTSVDDADLRGAYLQDANLREARLAYSNPYQAHLEHADLVGAHLEDANLREAHLQRALLTGAYLERASLSSAHLEGANLAGAHLEGASLAGAHLGGYVRPSEELEKLRLIAPTVTDFPQLTDLHLAFFDPVTGLNDAQLGNHGADAPLVADLHWNGANLAVVDWESLKMLGDERRARHRKDAAGLTLLSELVLDQFQAAVRANRQLATALRDQGLNEYADHFAYRAQVLQRQVLRQQKRLGRAIGSWLLDIVAGYGYKPMRSVFAYLAIIGLFAGAYLLNAQFAAPHLSWDEALVLSISAFHGRGFFTTGISLGDTLARLAAGEAIIGLLIEITFIATFTNRFFAR